MALGRFDEAIIHGFVNESEKVVVVAIDIQQPHLHRFEIEELGFGRQGPKSTWEYMVCLQACCGCPVEPK